MPLAWYAAPYKRRDDTTPGRYCAMDDFTTQILADGGNWTETEILGDHAIVKVRASDATLALIDAANGFFGVPKRWTDLTSSLATMTNGERNQISALVLSLGYTQAELDAAMGSTLALWRQKTLKTLLDFMATRRLQPRYNQPTDTIVCDGPLQPVRSVESVDAQVQ